MNFKLIHPTFYMSISPSGAGKSTYLRSVFEPEVIVEPDQIRKEITGSVSDQSRDREVWEEVLKRVLTNLDKKGQAILDATNTKSSLRTQFLKQLPAGVHKVALVFQPKGTDEEVVDKLYGRVQKDLEKGKDRSAVPKEVIARQLTQFKNGMQNIESQFDEVQIIDT
jgi:predicted kinase